MSIQQTSLSSLSAPRPQPWQQKQLSSGMKALTSIGFVLLAGTFIVSTMIFLLVMLPSFFQTLKPGDTMLSLMVGTAINLVVMVASLLSLIVIWPYATAPNRIKLSYAPVLASVRGASFDVQVSTYSVGSLDVAQRQRAL